MNFNYSGGKRKVALNVKYQFRQEEEEEEEHADRDKREGCVDGGYRD